MPRFVLTEENNLAAREHALAFAVEVAKFAGTKSPAGEIVKEAQDFYDFLTGKEDGQVKPSAG